MNPFTMISKTNDFELLYNCFKIISMLTDNNHFCEYGSNEIILVMCYAVIRISSLMMVIGFSIL